ncbi:MAG: MFS transporter [Alphaproteobacteria bacterium]|nr:MFS transporter [Alphaproteobacteria bacterium]
MAEHAVGITAPSEIRRHWGAVAACFVTAVFAWGLGFYGQSVYLAELCRLHGWSSFLIGSATTAFYLCGALLVMRVHSAIERLGPRAVLIAGSLLLGLGAVLFCGSAAPWQLYGAALVMASGWVCTTMAAISTVLALWFDRQRGLAISLALNGASAAGFLVTPVLSALSRRYGLVTAVAGTALALLCLLVPLVVFGMDPYSPRQKLRSSPEMCEDPRPAYRSSSEALADWRLWSVALPFALVLAAQVGFLIHLVALLRPQLGANGAAAAVAAASITAMLGRVGLGLIVDRLDQRRVSAASFLSQALALAAILMWPARPEVLYAGCCLFGLSVGNVITLPSLIIQREFAAQSFGLIVGLSAGIGQLTFAFGPALLGLIRDLTGEYAPALVLCIALQLVAAAIVLSYRPDCSAVRISRARPARVSVPARRARDR